MLGWLALADPEAHRLAGRHHLTAAWWVTWPIPIPATGLPAAAPCVAL